MKTSRGRSGGLPPLSRGCGGLNHLAVRGEWGGHILDVGGPDQFGKEFEVQDHR